MIRTHSIDPDIEKTAGEALAVIGDVLGGLSPATEFDYGGHVLKVGEYDVCERCTQPIAEAQAAENALLAIAEKTEDVAVKEHIELAARLFRAEAEAATLRAELHNGLGTENILNTILKFQYDRQINDEYTHSHHGSSA